MKKETQAVLDAKKAIEAEISSLQELLPRLDETFSHIVDMILACSGRVIVSGIGKSGHIGRKISSTLASTGTPSYFLHPAEAVHGDLGIVSADDIIILISNGGETRELIELLPSMKRLGVKIIAFVGKQNSTIAKGADSILDISVKNEACPLNLAPTSSTTATLVMGDALAIALLQQRNFKESDFALRHPGGKLGKKLILKVSDLMHSAEELPVISAASSIKDIVMEITDKKLGVVGILNSDSELTGIVTDGDLRRCIEKYENIFTLKSDDLMTKNPKTITADKLAMAALKIMEDYSITNLFVMDVDNPKKPLGLIHIHDILKAGLM